MKIKKEIPSANKRLRVAKIELRVRANEYENLKKAADANGVTLSEYVRRTISEVTSTPAGRIPEADLKKKQYLFALKVKEEFKKISSEIHSTAVIFKNMVGQLNQKGDPVLSDRTVYRTFNTMISTLTFLQGMVNDYFHLFGIKEEFYVHDDSISVPDIENVSIDSLKFKYTYMQKITIIGRLIDDAGTYNSKEGKQKIRFRVLCLNQDGKTQSKYTVFSAQSDIFPLLTKGKSVYAEGEFSINEKSEILIFAQIVRVIE